MTLQDFVAQNRMAIDFVITNTPAYARMKITDAVRETWVIDESRLYNMAIDSGVKFGGHNEKESAPA